MKKLFNITLAAAALLLLLTKLHPPNPPTSKPTSVPNTPPTPDATHKPTLLVQTRPPQH